MSVYIEEFDAFELDPQTGKLTIVPGRNGGVGPLAVQSVDNGATVAYSAALNAQTRFVRLAATAAVRWSEQSGTDGGAVNRYLPANEPEYFRVTGGNTIAVINA